MGRTAGLMGPDTSFLSLFQDNPNLTPEAKQRMEVALTVPAGAAPSGEIGIQTLEGGLYATARVYVPIEDYAEQWNRLVADWLPEGRYRVEIGLPVRPL